MGKKRTAARQPPARRVAASVNPRQLSPSMGDYGMDDRHMDGTEGFEDVAFVADVPSPAAGGGAPAQDPAPADVGGHHQLVDAQRRRVGIIWTKWKLSRMV